jgi:predicted DNA-binding transcriptional regulator AlpA
MSRTMSPEERRAKSAARRAKVAERIAPILRNFSNLPPEALIDDLTVAALTGRSRASVWRDVAERRLAPPVHVGARSTRWRVSDVRAALAGVQAA